MEGGTQCGPCITIRTRNEAHRLTPLAECQRADLDAGNDEILVSASDGATSVGETHENKLLRAPRVPRAFRDEIQRCGVQAVTCFQNIMSSFGLINVAYDLSRSFGFIKGSSFYYSQKYMTNCFTRVLGIAPLSGVLNEHLVSENSEISKFSGVGRPVGHSIRVVLSTIMYTL